MMENEIVKFSSYKDYKSQLDAELQKSAEGFVRIGYLLKVARDTDILKESGYSTVAEFAQAEYSIDKTQVSRFIHINDEFADGGYSPSLQDKYQGYGYAKLSLMLSLPEAVTDELTPEYTKAEINEIKETVAAETNVSDIEVAIEAAGEEKSEPLMLQAFSQLFDDRPDLYKSVDELRYHSAGGDLSTAETERIFEILAPSGLAAIMVRIKGIGGQMISIKGADVPVTLVNLRSNDKINDAWEDVIGYLNTILKGTGNTEQKWSERYGKPFPETEKPEVAPVQQKISKVIKPEPKKPAEKKPEKPIVTEHGEIMNPPEEVEDDEAEDIAGTDDDKPAEGSVDQSGSIGDEDDKHDDSRLEQRDNTPAEEPEESEQNAETAAGVETEIVHDITSLMKIAIKEVGDISYNLSHSNWQNARELTAQLFKLIDELEKEDAE